MATRAAHRPPRPASLTVPRLVGGPCSGRHPAILRAPRFQRRAVVKGAGGRAMRVPFPSSVKEMTHCDRRASAIARSQPRIVTGGREHKNILCCIDARRARKSHRRLFRTAAKRTQHQRHCHSGIGKTGEGKPGEGSLVWGSGVREGLIGEHAPLPGFPKLTRPEID